MDAPLAKSTASPTFPSDASKSPIAPAPTPPEAVTIGSLQAKLEDARREYTLRHDVEVERILTELENDPQAVMQASSAAEQLVERVFLRASVFCMKGRLLERKNAMVEAQDAFTQSVRLFEGQMSEMEEHKAATRLRTDYGIALSSIRRTQEAVDLLKGVCDGSAAPFEAFGYLGDAYRRTGHLVEAERAFSKGLQVVPGHPALLLYLAETMEAQGKRAEAVGAYCDAAQAENDPQTRAQIVQRALKIEPTDTRAFSIGFTVDFAGQDPDRSLAIVEAALQQDPHHAWALGLKGFLLRISGDLDEATKILRVIDVQTPELSWILVELAKTLHLFKSDHDTEALNLLDRASSLSPQDFAAPYAEALIRLDRRQFAEGVTALERAIKINPLSAPLQYELGRGLFLSKNLVGAGEAFDKALSLDPKSTAALTGKAAVLRGEGGLDQALDLYRRALRLEPDNEFAFQGLVEVLIQLDRISESVAELDGKIERNSQSSWARWRKGQVLLYQKDLNGAARAFESAVSLDPHNPDLIGDLAETLLDLEEYDTAGKAYDDLLQLEPDSARALGGKAIYLSEIASFHEASLLLDRAIEKAPDQAWLWGRQGWCLENLGPKSMVGARDAYKKALSIKKKDKNEDDLWERKGLANTLCQLGQKDEAGRDFEEIIEKQKYIEGNDAKILAALGWCHYRLARYDEAVRLLQASLVVDEDPSAQFDLGLVYLASSRASLASLEYQRAVDLASKKHRLRQRALYYIALFDLVEATREKSFGPEDEAIFALLCDHLRHSGVELAALSWLEHRLLAGNTK